MKRTINVAAVVVAAVVHFALGAAWFTALAKPWMAGLRMSEAELKAAQQNPSLMPYLMALLCNLVLAYAIAWIAARTEPHTTGRGIVAGAVVGLIAAVAMITEFAFELRPGTFSAIAAGYPLLGCIIMGAIIGAWKKKQNAEMAKMASA